MAIFVDQMFGSLGESTSLADLDKGTTAVVGAYVPKYDGTLIGVVIEIASVAATSLVEGVRVELNCTIWKPNLIMFGGQGSGLRTAPGVQLKVTYWTVDQPVKTNQSISGQYIHASGTPVTSYIRVWGIFQV